jgi:hypothetical protein
MRIPRVRFTIRSMMILIVLIAVVLGLAMFTSPQSRDQNNDAFINDQLHTRWRIPGTPRRRGHQRGQTPVDRSNRREEDWGQTMPVDPIALTS